MSVVYFCSICENLNTNNYLNVKYKSQYYKLLVYPKYLQKPPLVSEMVRVRALLANFRMDQGKRTYLQTNTISVLV